MPGETAARVLKVGLVQDGKLIEDSVLGSREGLTIGLDPTNKFSIAEPAAPRRHMLIEYTQHGYKLNLLPEMKGRMLIDDRTIELAELISSGKAVKSPKGGYEMPLVASSKGKIAIGGSTILFQLVPPPPPPAMMKLPKELKASFFRNVDMFFLIVLVISAVLHAAMIYYLENVDYNEEEAMKVATERFVQIVEEDIIVPEEETQAEDEEGGKKGGGGGGGGGGQQAVENKGIIAVIGRLSTQSGAVADLLSESGLGGDLTNALNSIGGVKVGKPGDIGIGGGTKGSGSGPGGGSGVGIGDIGNAGRGGSVGTGDRSERKITAKLSTADGGVSGKIDASKVRGYIRSQLGGVRHCYEMQLKSTPTLEGKVKVMFTIGSSGDVVSCSVAQNTMGNTLVGDCVCRRVQRWRFPPPDEGTVTVSYTFIFQPAE